MHTIVIIGGGASGYFCSANIPANAGKRVIIVEKTAKTLSKVKISGGGRCNVTNLKYPEIPIFAQQYPRGARLLKKTLNQFSASETVAWFAAEGVKIVMEPDGRSFPESNDSQSIIDALERKCFQKKDEILLRKEVTNISKRDDVYELKFADGTRIIANVVVIASGGYQKMNQYQWQGELNLPTDPPIPSLFTFNTPKNPITALMGVATNAQIKIAGTKLSESGPVLITHWGLSGPAVLRLSAWGALKLAELQYNFTAVINWIPDYDEASLLQFFSKQKKENALKALSAKTLLQLPQRLWLYLLHCSDISEQQRWADLPAKAQNKLSANLLQFQLPVNGKTTFREEFVNAGGISPAAIDPDTMMSRQHANLYVIGEALNVDGITGGFNFQHAWSSGYIAAKSIMEQ